MLANWERRQVRASFGDRNEVCGDGFVQVLSAVVVWLWILNIIGDAVRTYQSICHSRYTDWVTHGFLSVQTFLMMH